MVLRGVHRRRRGTMIMKRSYKLSKVQEIQLEFQVYMGKIVGEHASGRPRITHTYGRNAATWKRVAHASGRADMDRWPWGIHRRSMSRTRRLAPS